ncbi:MAG: hypothetical protein Q7S87_09980 [Agitococcus sp.]|nr:hypothetical protein [Agitococcus sp.]
MTPQFITLLLLLLVGALTGCSDEASKTNAFNATAAYTSAISNVTKKITPVTTGIGAGLFNGLATSAATQNTFRRIEPSLALHQLKINESSPQCITFAELTLAVQQATAGRSKEEQATQVDDTIKQGVKAGCYVKKSALDLMPAEFKRYWEPRHAKLKDTATCSNYPKWSNEIAFSNHSPEDKQLFLAQLFADATLKSCMN